MSSRPARRAVALSRDVQIGYVFLKPAYDLHGVFERIDRASADGCSDPDSGPRMFRSPTEYLNRLARPDTLRKPASSCDGLLAVTTGS
jgi:hypothetical protein